MPGNHQERGLKRRCQAKHNTTKLVVVGCDKVTAQTRATWTLRQIGRERTHDGAHPLFSHWKPDSGTVVPPVAADGSVIGLIACASRMVELTPHPILLPHGLVFMLSVPVLRFPSIIASDLLKPVAACHILANSPPCLGTKHSPPNQTRLPWGRRVGETTKCAAARCWLRRTPRVSHNVPSSMYGSYILEYRAH
ncbi:hypothetical protein B0H10DRAFT_1963739 [Mycena sp. CBHHK59/15]|nr:hypothetical protein B0H10DRAFT_1963739 [Mycena sp. CBHHK59/15]